VSYKSNRMTPIACCLIGSMISTSLIFFHGCDSEPPKETIVSTTPSGGKAEATGSRVVTKVPSKIIEKHLASIPTTVRIVVVVPVYKGFGDSFDVSHYLVVTETSKY